MLEPADLVKVRMEPFLVVGIEERTTNEREMSGQGAIGPLWGRLTKDALLERIPQRMDDRIIAVYSDYQNGKDGEYSYLLGAKVRAATHVPDGMASRQVRVGEYALFTAKGRPAAEMVIGIWKEIWSLETAKKLERAYRTDFEVYYNGPGGKPPNTLVDVYIGLRSG
jgi:predicted transcriptional regulator YdeE